MPPTASPAPTVTLTPSPMPTRGPETYYRRFILINQDTQTMLVYENGVRIRTIPVSTGKPDQEETMTPAWEGDVGKYVGTFFSFGTWADNAWYLFDHYGSMLIHSAPYLQQDGVKVYQDLDALGARPLSHGCIRLPPEEAQWFTDWGPQGAHVIIQPLTRKL
jgi:lipoprotein-anchoring transpeptidase ErfK/SrfK